MNKQVAFGMAAVGGKGHALPCATIITFGILAWYSLVSFARAAEAVLVKEPFINQSTLAAVWSRTIPNGKSTTFIPDIACLCLTAGTLLVTSAFMGDLFVSLLDRLSFIPLLLRKRWVALLSLHSLAIWPLCLLKRSSTMDLHTLPGLVGVLYTLLVIVKRFLDKSYHRGGTFFEMTSESISPNLPSEFQRGQTGLLSVAKLLPRLRTGHGLLVLMSTCCLACMFSTLISYTSLFTKHITFRRMPLQWRPRLL